MKHPYTVTWLAEGCVVQALPTPRGRRNALLLNRGLVTAVLRLSEEDYQELLSGGSVSSDTKGGGPGGDGLAARDNGGSARSGGAGRSHMGLVPGGDTSSGKPTGA